VGGLRVFTPDLFSQEEAWTVAEEEVEMIIGAAVVGFLAGLFPGVVIGYRKARREMREAAVASRPVKPWGGIDAEHAGLGRE
jgi:hypothetical protein